MRNLASSIFLIAVLLAYFTFQVLTTDISLGTDLRGGVSLVYSVTIDDEENADAVLSQIVRVLKDRLNPQGVYDLTIQAQGENRIEIVTPLPSEEVKQLLKDYNGAVIALVSETQINRRDLDAALNNGKAVEQFGERGGRITKLVDDFEAWNSAIGAYEAIKNDDPSPALYSAATQAARTTVVKDGSIQDVLAMSIERSRIDRAVRLTKKASNARSPRKLELERMKTEYPHIADKLDDVVKKFDAYSDESKGFDDPEDLKRLVRATGVLEYYIAVSPGEQGIDIAALKATLDESGPDAVRSRDARWFPINNLGQWYDDEEERDALVANSEAYFATRYSMVAAERDGVYYVLLNVRQGMSLTAETKDWSVESASRSQDQLGRPAVAFRLNQVGGRLMGQLTGQNVGRQMAIVLDDEVYSAPILQGQITTSGIIRGNFSPDEIDYLIRVLASGSLEARISPEPISAITVGPSIGQDNLKRGLDACKIAVIAVAVFMLAYYFLAGAVANIALLANGILIFGVMFMLDGTFTLPGLAGIVLTIGMAVDANVLIYERIREEMFAGEDLRTSIREGYRKAMSTIIDANVTNLIVCLILMKTATTEVRGFAVTLTIGICATLFTALFLTRVIYALYTDVWKRKKLVMLPTRFPAIHRMLEPSVRWVHHRKVFWVFSGIAVIASLLLVGSRGVDMFDTEFRGGVSVTMNTAFVDDDKEKRVVLKLEDVERAVHAIAEGVPDPDTASDDETRVLYATKRMLAEAVVLTSGDTVDVDGDVGASSFQIKVASPKGISEEATIKSIVVNSIVATFEGELDVTPKLSFDGDGADGEPVNFREYTRPIRLETTLGEVLDNDRYQQNVADMQDGVAIVIRNIDPPVSTEDVLKRVERMRNTPAFAGAEGRKVRVLGLTDADPNQPALGYTAVAVLVKDPELNYDAQRDSPWDTDVRKKEWDLVTASLSQETSLDQVSSFSPAIASTLQANAAVAVILSLLGILLYIWIRFGSLRYSVAAIVALVHDVTIALGLLALTHIVGGTVLGERLKIEEFRIDLGVVAALLTIIGYSLNDTIVILDRIRENRGKLPLASANTVNLSINQCFSRTVLTSVTTLVAVFIMYAQGGSGIRPFTFCLLIGIFVGTYSSVAIAAPLVFKHGTDHDPEESPSDAAAKAEEAGRGGFPTTA